MSDRVLESLKAKHSTLDKQVLDEQRGPARNSLRLRDLKSEKLRVKDRMERIKNTAMPRRRAA